MNLSILSWKAWGCIYSFTRSVKDHWLFCQCGCLFLNIDPEVIMTTSGKHGIKKSHWRGVELLFLPCFMEKYDNVQTHKEKEHFTSTVFYVFCCIWALVSPIFFLVLSSDLSWLAESRCMRFTCPHVHQWVMFMPCTFPPHLHAWIKHVN